ncbi:MAG: type II toxin-antitoxin system RelE/ParE family toxin [Prevotella sp.]|nr:type II toxin-antitoxin system RelE/ParE family toxin [Prevotella sp.]
MLKVIWGKRAFRIFVRQWRWEGDNVGLQAAETMRRNVAETIKQIQQTPTIGRYYKTIGKKTYRIALTHPKSSLFYWYDDQELHIVRFLIAMRNTQTL